MPVGHADPFARFLDTEAARIDREGGLPLPAVDRLRADGLLAAPLLPMRAGQGGQNQSGQGPGEQGLGGQGLGTMPDGALPLLALLRRIGSADLSMGRLFEGHVNAIRLVVRFGDEAQQNRVADDVLAGHLVGLWVTDEQPVRLRRRGQGWVLEGQKSIASGVGLATRALITVQPDAGEPRMALVSVDPAVAPGTASLSGMRGAATGRCDFTGVVLDHDALIGAPGDYLRQPDFSAGAWRGSAVALGGIDRLLDLLRTRLSARGRDKNPHQRIRIGDALIARETAVLWCRRAALLAETEGFEAGDVQATVNLARIAVERAGLQIIELTQRALGLQAFLRGDPVERVMRDLATYLRQPAPDETLVEAAGWFTTRDMPNPDLVP